MFVQVRVWSQKGLSYNFTNTSLALFLISVTQTLQVGGVKSSFLTQLVIAPLNKCLQIQLEKNVLDPRSHNHMLAISIFFII